MIYEWQSTNLFQESLYYQYWICTYSSCLFLVGRDLHPRGYLQTTLGAWIIVFGMFVLSYLFGELALLVRELNARQYML